jgi:hypothetical protein
MKKNFFDNIQYIELVEALDNGNRYKCIIIKPGVTISANTYTMHEGKRIAVKKNYPASVLQEAVTRGMFEGVSMLLRSESDHLAQKNGDIKNVVGYFTETSWDGQQVTGILNIKQSRGLAGAFKEHLLKLWESTKKIGLSITGFGEWVIEKINNEYVATVTSLEEVTSVDPCQVGNAGGQIVALSESELNINNKFTNQNKIKTMDAKTKTGLFLFLQKKGKINQDANESDFTGDQLLDLATGRDMAEFKDLDTEPAAPAPAPQATSTQQTTQETPDEELQRTLNMAKELVAEANFKKILSESKLNQKAKDFIEQRYKRQKYVFDEKELKYELQEQAKLLAESNGAGFYSGLNSGFTSGFPNIKVGTEEVDKYQLGLEWLLANAAIKNSFTDVEKRQFQEAGVTGLYSFKEFYKELTGDYNISGFEGKGKLSEAISTSSFPVLLGNALHRNMIRAYKMSAYQTDWRKIVKIVPRTDFKENSIVYKGGYADIPPVNEGAVYLVATTPAEQANIYNVKKRGNLETITREAIYNDDISTLQDTPFALGEAAARTLYKFVFDFLITNPTMDYDSLALFHATHANLTAGAVVLSATTFNAGRLAMWNQTDLTSGKKLGYMPKYLAVPVDLQETAYQLTTPAYGQNNSVATFNQTWNVEPIIIATATDATDWYLIGDPLRGVPTIEIGFLNGKEDPEILLQDQPVNGQVFTHDIISYKIRHEYDGAVMNHRGFYKYAHT